MWVSLRTVEGSSCVPKVLPVGVGVEIGVEMGRGWGGNLTQQIKTLPIMQTLRPGCGSPVLTLFRHPPEATMPWLEEKAALLCVYAATDFLPCGSAPSQTAQIPAD